MTCKNCDCKETKPYVEGAMQCVDCDEIFNNILCPSCTAPKPATDKEIADVAREYVARILMPGGGASTQVYTDINTKLRELVNRGK